MRRITRNFALGLVVVVVLLLALGALPGFLKSGDPYYMSASPVEANESVQNVSVNATELPELRFPYANGALGNATNATGMANATGYSKPYWRGPFGIKGTFTHSPFDELGSMQTLYPNATDADGAFVQRNNTIYRLTVTQQRTQ